MSKSVINSQLICANYEKNYPLLESGKGIYLYDNKGNEYIDTSGCTAAVTHIGHGVEEISNILKEQAQKLAVYPTHLFYHEGLDNYLEDLCQMAPEGFNKAWTISGGTGAVENSIKLAFQYHKSRGTTRTKVIGRWGSYHGNSILALDVGGMVGRRSYYTDIMFNHLHVNACHPFRKPSEMSLEEYENSLVSEFEKTVNENKDEIMCFIAEPIVGAALGAVSPTKSYFKRIYKICRDHDILLIADEVMTGLGRTGTNFGMNHFGNHCDIIAMAKGISSGYLPLGAISAHDRVLDTIKATGEPFYSGQTYSCIPLASAVGHGVLNYINKHKLVENSKNVGNYLKEKFLELQDHKYVADIRGEGLFLGIEFVENKKNNTSFDPGLKFSKKLEAKCLENGLVTYGCQGSNNYTAGDHILFAPPLILTNEQADQIFIKLKKSLDELKL